MQVHVYTRISAHAYGQTDRQAGRQAIHSLTYAHIHVNNIITYIAVYLLCTDMHTHAHTAVSQIEQCSMTGCVDVDK